MYDKEYIIEYLGLTDKPTEEQDEAFESAAHFIGDVIDKGLTEQQQNEYTAIINDDRGVIDAWLAQHVPDYKQSPVYQQFEEGVAEDPEQNNPEKLFASVAWMQFNVPNTQQVVDTALANYKQQLQDKGAQ